MKPKALDWIRLYMASFNGNEWLLCAELDYYIERVENFRQSSLPHFISKQKLEALRHNVFPIVEV
jgi:hypothetical protein